MPTTDISVLGRVPGVGAATVDAFRESGYQTLEDLEGITEQALTEVPGVGPATAEAMPMRIASIALGTGDLDCVYHFALDELQATLDEIDNEDQREMLNTLVDGRRLRDISDLPFDLAT